MLLLLVYTCIALPISAQRYAERNVLPADTFPSSDATYGGDEYDYDGYGFDYDKEPGVYKWNVKDYPHPVTTPRFCNRLKPSNVCDPDQVLEKEQVDVLDSFIQKLYQETPCICEACSEGDGGIVVGIALLKHMFLPYNVHPVKAIRSFAETLRFHWKLGRCDNDILIVVATTDRLSYTDVGKTTSDYLSIHEAHRIFLENKAKFSASNFSEGLLDILEGYYKSTSIMKEVLLRKKDKVDITMVSGIIVGSVVLLGIILFVGFVIYRRYRAKKNLEDDENPQKVRGDSVSSSWKKKDIRVFFGSDNHKAPKLSNAKYQQCGTDEGDRKGGADDEEIMDFTLATPDDTSFPNETLATPDDTSFPNETQVTNVTSDSENLEKDLTEATEGIVRTFPKSGKNVFTTDI